jgi:hypothetical protein
MGGTNPLQYWEVWYPQAAATGLLIARGLMDTADMIILHAPPPVLTVSITEENGSRLAYGEKLEATDETPMCRLTRHGERITRADIWPTAQDYGSLVLLPGGEVGVLQYWWNSDDRQEWRWRVEFYNSLRSDS